MNITDCKILICFGTKQPTSIYKAVEKNPDDKPIEITMLLHNDEIKELVKFLKEREV